MNERTERNIGKGNDDNLREYRLKREKQRVIRRVIVLAIATALVLVLTFLIVKFGFVVRTMSVDGTTGYTEEEILKMCGVALGDNIFAVSEDEVETALKKAFPYIKRVTLDKQYPSDLVIKITEEYTTYYYESEGEYFLFNHGMRLMDKFDSLSALKNVRDAILVTMPLPKSSIVPQYIILFEKSEYISDIIQTLSDSKLVEYVTYLDVRDKFLLRMECGKSVSVELGDNQNLKEKFALLAKLLGEEGKNMTGSVDLTCYPQCFHALQAEYD